MMQRFISLALYPTAHCSLTRALVPAFIVCVLQELRFGRYSGCRFFQKLIL